MPDELDDIDFDAILAEAEWDAENEDEEYDEP